MPPSLTGLPPPEKLNTYSTGGVGCLVTALGVGAGDAGKSSPELGAPHRQQRQPKLDLRLRITQHTNADTSTRRREGGTIADHKPARSDSPADLPRPTEVKSGKHGSLNCQRENARSAVAI